METITDFFYFLYRDIRECYYNIKYFFINAWLFRKVRYWDHYYLIEANIIVIEKMIESFEGCNKTGALGAYVGIEDDINDMITTVSALKRLQNWDYSGPIKEREELDTQDRELIKRHMIDKGFGKWWW